MEQNVIYVCAGLEYTDSYLIANTGENGGNDYSFEKASCVVYLDKKIIINSVVCSMFRRLFHVSISNCDIVSFREAGNRAPEFSYDAHLSEFVAQLLELMLDSGSFRAKDLNVRKREQLPRKGNSAFCDYLYTVDSLYCLNKLVDEYMKFSYLEFSELFKGKIYNWNFIEQKKIIPNHLLANKVPRFILNNDSVKVGVKCGYVYPFDEFNIIQDDTYECICHKPIFTIYLSQKIAISYEECINLSKIIASLCTLDMYSEICSFCENKFKFVFNAKLNDFIISILNAMFNSRYIFEDGDFHPEVEFEYREFDIMTVERIYKSCVNLNAQIYLQLNNPYYPRIIPRGVFSGVIKQTLDLNYHSLYKLNKYPIDFLIKNQINTKGTMIKTLDPFNLHKS